MFVKLPGYRYIDTRPESAAGTVPEPLIWSVLSINTIVIVVKCPVVPYQLRTDTEQPFLPAVTETPGNTGLYTLVDPCDVFLYRKLPLVGG